MVKKTDYNGIDKLYKAALEEDLAHKKMVKVAREVIRGSLRQAMFRVDKNLYKKLDDYTSELSGARLLKDINHIRGKKVSSRGRGNDII